MIIARMQPLFHDKENVAYLQCALTSGVERCRMHASTPLYTAQSAGLAAGKTTTVSQFCRFLVLPRDGGTSTTLWLAVMARDCQCFGECAELVCESVLKLALRAQRASTLKTATALKENRDGITLYALQNDRCGVVWTNQTE